MKSCMVPMQLSDLICISNSRLPFQTSPIVKLFTFVLQMCLSWVLLSNILYLSDLNIFIFILYGHYVIACFIFTLTLCETVILRFPIFLLRLEFTPIQWYQIIQFRQCFIYCAWTVCTKLCCGSLRELWLSLFICHLYCCYDFDKNCYYYYKFCMYTCIYIHIPLYTSMYIWQCLYRYIHIYMDKPNA